jgi:hypothetical protein
VRTKDVRWVDTTKLPGSDPRFDRQLIAQEFIDTGPYVESHRVMVVLGRPVYSVSSRLLGRRSPVDMAKAVDVPIASNAGERMLVLNFDREIIDLAARAQKAFPELALLGVDVIRQESSGKLYILEVNSGLGTWHISSDYFAPYREKFGLDLHGQFGALDIIADALIDVTRQEAA